MAEESVKQVTEEVTESKGLKKRTVIKVGTADAQKAVEAARVKPTALNAYPPVTKSTKK